MIVAGDNRVFAIAAEITGTESGWIFGRFRFVFHSYPCGNWSDETDLKACYSWLKDFIENPRARFEPGLMEMSNSDVFDRLIKPVLADESKAVIPEAYQDTFSRFHISHLGMSSFDRIIMVLIESSELQRCVWHVQGEPQIHDDRFPSGHMQQVAMEFCRLFEREV